jgi:hypothetical protein
VTSDSVTDESEQPWRWLGLTVGGTVLPFAIFALAYVLAAGYVPSPVAILGSGELFIPASIMNVEAMWIFRQTSSPLRLVVFATCGFAALSGAICFGITAALEIAPSNRIHITKFALQQLSQTVTLLSGGEFLMAFVIGTMGVALHILTKKAKGLEHG